jgi:membrane-associated PAP2 superfamily phosphatase
MSSPQNGDVVNVADSAACTTASSGALSAYRTSSRFTPRAALMLILAIGLPIALVFGLYPKLDLSISGAFYDRPQHDWPVTRNDLLILHRNFSAYVAAILVIFAIGSAAVGAIRRGRPALMSWRDACFLLGSLLLGPGLIVNVLLKPEWARPRPADVIDLGGKLHFVPWWNPFGDCDGNCSFVSGETSLAFWMLAFAIVLPQRYRLAAIVAALANCLILGAGRIAVGGHFTSDVLLAVVLTALAMWLVHRIAFADLAALRWPRRRAQHPENGGIGPRAPLSRNA